MRMGYSTLFLVCLCIMCIRADVADDSGTENTTATPSPAPVDTTTLPSSTEASAWNESADETSKANKIAATAASLVSQFKDFVTLAGTAPTTSPQVTATIKKYVEDEIEYATSGEWCKAELVKEIAKNLEVPDVDGRFKELTIVIKEVAKKTKECDGDGKR